MKLGLFLTTAQMPGTSEADVFSRSLTYVDEADRLGFEQVWILEHHFTPYGLCPSALQLASFVLGRSSRLEVGTAISIIALEHPIKIAEQAALLDHLSRGRFRLGIGRGLFRKPFDVFGVDMAKSFQIVQEWLEVFLRLWTEEKVVHHGEFARFPEITLRPRPFSQPHPPVHIVCTSTESIKWAARNACPMIMNYRIPDQQKVTQLDVYAQEAAAHGHDPSRIEHAISGVAFVADSDAEAMRLVRPGLEWWIRQGLLDSGLFQSANRVQSYDRYYREISDLPGEFESAAENLAKVVFDLNPIGSPQRCLKWLQGQIERTGITNYILGFEGAESEALTLEAMRRFATEVWPQVTAAEAQVAF